VLILASITEPLVRLATNVVGDLGLAGVFVLMTLESACIPIPSEATMLFAGFNVSLGHYSLLAATLVGASANLVGSWIAYAVGYYGRIELLEKHGRKLHVSQRNLEQADRWFERYGAAAVLVTRMLPIVRTFISLPAGVARMPFWRFSILTFVGCLPWVFLLAFVGKQAQDNWTSWKDKLHYVDYVVLLLIVAAVAWYGVRWWRKRRGDGGGSGEGMPEDRDGAGVADVRA
jgi:membrane protein DedA with SNARE-associated domain